MTLTIKERLHQQIDIKNRLELAGYTLRDIDRLYKLPKISAQRTLYEPNTAAEEAIAAALGVEPHTLWTGLRHSPQPPENYERLPSIAQRRNGNDSIAQRRNGNDQLTPVKRTQKKKDINKRTFGSQKVANQNLNQKRQVV